MGVLLDAYIFGSVGRGEQDGKSDLDILAVVKNHQGTVPEIEVTSLIPRNLDGLKPSIAWYGEARLREMFANGELFAWHLFLEARPMTGSGTFLRSLGRPNTYQDALADAASFSKVMAGIPTQIADSAFNAVYESGLMYVCLRNIAMAASSLLCNRPDFSRYSPFHLTSIAQCPISVEAYEKTMACRLAGQRGFPPPMDVEADFVIGLYTALAPWLNLVLRTLKEKQDGQRKAADQI